MNLYSITLSTNEPNKVFLRTGERGIYFRETGEQRLNFDVNRGTKTIGERIFFFIFGEQANLFRGTREKVSPGRAS